MYIYFDADGTLKEIVQVPVRQGSKEQNTIYIFVAPTVDNLIEGTYKRLNTYNNAKINFELVDTNETLGIGSNPMDKDTKQIPFNKNRDLKYFKYGYNYEFFTIELPSAVTTVNGVVGATVYLFNNGQADDFALNTFAFNVEYSVGIKSDGTITDSQYSYLYNLYQSFASGNVYVPYEGAIRDLDLGSYAIMSSDEDGLTLKSTNLTEFNFVGDNKILYLNLNNISTSVKLYVPSRGGTIATTDYYTGTGNIRVGTNGVIRIVDDPSFSELRVDNGQYQLYVESISADMAGISYNNGEDLTADIRIYQGVPEIQNSSDNYSTNMRIGTNGIRIEKRNLNAGTSEEMDLFDLLEKTKIKTINNQSLIGTGNINISGATIYRHEVSIDLPGTGDNYITFVIYNSNGFFIDDEQSLDNALNWPKVLVGYFFFADSQYMGASNAEGVFIGLDVFVNVATLNMDIGPCFDLINNVVDSISNIDLSQCTFSDNVEEM